MQEADTRTRLVKTTARLVRARGYFGTGIQEILKLSGVPKGSLYHHFPTGKDGLVVEALQYASAKMMETFEEAMRGTKTPKRGLSAIVEVLANQLEDSAYREGCPLATVTLEMDSGKPEIRQACKDLYRMWEEAVSGYLALKQVRDARVKARIFLTMIEGGYVLAKAHGDASFMRRIAGDLDMILN